MIHGISMANEGAIRVRNGVLRIVVLRIVKTNKHLEPAIE